MSLIVCLINICICRLQFVPAEKEALFYQVPEYLFLFVVSFSFGLSITLCMLAVFADMVEKCVEVLAVFLNFWAFL